AWPISKLFCASRRRKRKRSPARFEWYLVGDSKLFVSFAAYYRGGRKQSAGTMRRDTNPGPWFAWIPTVSCPARKVFSPPGRLAESEPLRLCRTFFEFESLDLSHRWTAPAELHGMSLY